LTQGARALSLDHACGNGRATLAERGMDLYETPAAESFLRDCGLRYLPLPPFKIWEPACGRGAIVRVLRAGGYDTVATDLVDYASPDQDAAGRDFLVEREAPEHVRAIVTNPPFKLAGDFVEHGLRLVPVVAMLLRLAFLESDRRSGILDSGKLRSVLVYRKRLPMMHRDGWEGRKANRGMAFAWFVWDRAHSGTAEMRRISWDRVP
jgi:hypothetical protein